MGYALNSVKLDGNVIPKGFLQVNYQTEVGNEAYDEGAKILTDFFKEQLEPFNVKELDSLGKQIIDACMKDASVEDYFNLIPKL